MSEATAKVHAKPSGYTDGGKVWLNDKSRFGMRFACKSCGRKGSGYGTGERYHSSECALVAPYHAQRAADAKAKSDKASAGRALLAGIDWATVSDDLAIRLVAEVSK